MKIKQDKHNLRKHGAKNKAAIRKSLEECGAGRSVLVDADDTLIAGNGVFEQAEKLGIPVKVIETDGSELVVVKRTDLHETDAVRKKLAAADNLIGDLSEWDGEMIKAEGAFEIFEEFGVEFEPFEEQKLDSPTNYYQELEKAKREDPKERAQGRNLNWGTSRGDKDEARCNLVEKPSVHFRGGGAYVATYHRTPEGVPLSEIKAPEQVELFADNAVKLIEGLIGTKYTKDMCLITTPRRRHTEWNFADEICKRVSEKTGIHYEPDTITARTKQRIAPEFKLEKAIPQSTIILYDDIVTTGATILAARELFPMKNIVTIIGICNLTT